MTPPRGPSGAHRGLRRGAAVLRRAQSLAGGSAEGVTARPWHLLNLPAGSDVSRLHTQNGALGREVRRSTVQLEFQRRPAERQRLSGALRAAS